MNLVCISYTIKTMRLHRFIGDFETSGNEVKIHKSENIKQIKGVLRLRVGDHLILADGQGRQGEFEITEILKTKISCKLVKELLANEPQRKVSLYLAILKKENFELAIQKAVECGVSEIIPVLNDRTVKTGFKKTRLEKIILEAAEQCGRTDVPKLSEKTKFKEALELAKHAHEKLIFDEAGEEYQPEENAKSIAIFIGPEGGFTQDEVALARARGFKQTSLGPLILRGETAAIVATYRAVQGI